MQADATVAPTCIDIIYILHVYLSLCVLVCSAAIEMNSLFTDKVCTFVHIVLSCNIKKSKNKCQIV
jgi:ABC-type protease/lipase transport system fused ATPase/permease subunit